MMIERILAPNPSLYTGPGTNTYLVRSMGEALVIDPGPVIDSHAAEITRALGGDRAVGVLVTHTHPDHAPLANPLATELGIPVYGFGPGPAFTPDITLGDGDSVSFGGSGASAPSEVVAVHTPGHTPDHLCFRLDDVLFTGDHIMEGSTVVIEDARDYLDSLYRVEELGVTRLEPGHGAAIDDARSAVRTYIDHRLERERQILHAIGDGAHSVDAIVDVVYAEVPVGLRPAASQQVQVQLTKLFADGAVWFDGAAGGSSAVRLR